MRILMVIGNFWPIIGGAENQALRLAKCLKAKGHAIRVLTRTHGKYKREDNIDGIQVCRMRARGFLFYIFKQRTTIDIIHIHQGLEVAIFPVLIAKLFKIPTIIKIANSAEKFDLHVLKRSFFWGAIGVYLLRRFVTCFVAMTDQIDKELITCGIDKRKIEKIPNGVVIPPPLSAQRAIHLRHELNLEEWEIRVTFVGRLIPTKNVIGLINAWETVVKENKISSVLLIIGKGILEAPIETIIRNKKLQKNIRLIGEVNNVDEYLAISNVFVLPSFTEGLSNALLEAMAHGLPCIVSDIPSHKEILRNGEYGVLVNPKNLKEISKELGLLIDDEELRDKFGEKSKNHICRDYSFSTITQKYEKLYEKLVINI